MSLTVALILNIESVMAVEALARTMPVWIASTSAHAKLKDSLKLVPEPPPVTWFPLRENESLEDAAVRISYSLDDHFNELAQKDSYRFLFVVGAAYSKSIEPSLRELDFKHFESMSFGFVAGK